MANFQCHGKQIVVETGHSLDVEEMTYVSDVIVKIGEAGPNGTMTYQINKLSLSKLKKVRTPSLSDLRTVYLCLSVTLCLFFTLSLSLFRIVCLSLCICFSLSLSPTLISPSVSVSLLLSLCLSISVSLCLSLPVSVPLSVSLSVCLSLCLSLSLSLVCVCVCEFYISVLYKCCFHFCLASISSTSTFTVTEKKSLKPSPSVWSNASELHLKKKMDSVYKRATKFL